MFKYLRQHPLRREGNARSVSDSDDDLADAREIFNERKSVRLPSGVILTQLVSYWLMRAILRLALARLILETIIMIYFRIY
jgi:hypothetical protein